MTTNRYPGLCYHCLKSVPAKAGVIERVNGGWLTAHLACSEKARPVQLLRDPGEDSADRWNESQAR